ncbi:MAG TPA: energy transducer TonB [Candidatus Acidoferrales bacterium]|nr:energy transducer TonB [Candidatus Acidoferrales bacterium]
MNVPSGKESGLPRLTIEKAPRLRTLIENFRDAVKHSARVPAAVAGGPFELLEGRSRTGKLGPAQCLSLAVHIGAIAALAMLLHNVTKHSPGILREIPNILYPRHIVKENPGAKPSVGQGSGGHDDPRPAAKGFLAFASTNPIIPPRPPISEAPLVPVIPTIPDPRAISKNILPMELGLPWMRDVNGSQGPGGPEGYGSTKGHSMGDSQDGTGGRGNALTPYAAGASYPECVYCPRPGFTDEARQQKLQGTVMLEVVVTADGRAGNIRITKGLGLGLDERAVEAVRNWRFKPARDAAGHALPVWIPVEMTFHLY